VIINYNLLEDLVNPAKPDLSFSDEKLTLVEKSRSSVMEW